MSEEEVIKSTENSINETCKLLQDIPFINKKSADEMFEKLDYIKYEGEYVCKYEYDKAGLEVIIKFNLKYSTITISMYDKDEKRKHSPEITMQELQSINQKCKELGWLDE